MTIHTENPFAGDDDPLRRFRGRVGGVVSLWTSGTSGTSGTGGPQGSRAGLTVTSFLVAAGDPPHVLGLLDPDSALAEVAAATGRVVVHLLEWEHRDLAEAFAGQAPAPGGVFRLGTWTESEWGPVLDSASAWVGLRLEPPRAVGWSSLLDGVVEHVRVAESDAPLVHRRGRYQRPTRDRP